jgi:hypothetical protein
VSVVTRLRARRVRIPSSDYRVQGFARCLIDT